MSPKRNTIAANKKLALSDEPPVEQPTLAVVGSSTSGGGRLSKSSSRRQEILDIATEVFAQKGIIAATVRDVSDRTGILAGSLYHHFASKTEMIVEILSPVLESQISMFDRVVSEHSDPSEILQRVIAAELMQSADNPQVARILRQDESHISGFPGLEEIAAKRRVIRASIETVIAKGIEMGQFRPGLDARVTTMALFDITLGAYRHLPPLGSHTVESLVDHLTVMVMQGLIVPE